MADKYRRPDNGRFRQSPNPARTASHVLKALFKEADRQRMSMIILATELDMTRVGLTYWKHGRCDPDITKVEALAQVLGYRLVLEPIEGNPHAKIQGDQVR